MKAIYKIKLISEILDRYDEGTCLYCGSTLNGDLEADEYEEECLEAIDKVIHDRPFKP